MAEHESSPQAGDRAVARLALPETIAWAASAVLLLAVSSYELFAHLAARAWQTDEPVYRNAARAIGEYGNWSHNLEHPMLGKYAIMASEAVFGTDPWATRLPSALASLVAGIVLALLGWEILRTAAPRSPRAAMWGSLAVAAIWLLLPHPGPDFDVTRLAYLDGLMAAGIAGALWAGWRWGERFAIRWALPCGAAAGCALAAKLPSLFLLVPLCVLLIAGGASGVRIRTRLASFAVVNTTALAVLLATWAPLRGDLPHALRFLASMQTRDVGQSLEIAGRTYEHAPVWTQAWWQWHDWPAFAAVQLASLVAVWFVVPRRAAAFLVASAVAPALAYAVLGGRILPHWQVTWQVGMCALVGIVAARSIAIAIEGRITSWQRACGIIGGVVTLAVVVFHSTQRFDHVRHLGDSGARGGDRAASAGRRSLELDRYLDVADRPRRFVVDVAGARVARSLSYARVIGPRERLLTTYHSAAESQHPWVIHDGGTPPETTQRDLELDPPRVGDVTAIVERRGSKAASTYVPRDLLISHYVPHEIGPYVLWLNNDLRAPTTPG